MAIQKGPNLREKKKYRANRSGQIEKHISLV
jgi:hypothetical protein